MIEKKNFEIIKKNPRKNKPLFDFCMLIVKAFVFFKLISINIFYVFLQKFTKRRKAALKFY